MEGIIFATLLAVLFAIGCPIAFALIVATAGFILAGSAGFPLEIVVQRMWGVVSSSALAAIPMYVLTAVVMNNMGLTERIYRFALALVGHLRGGLYYVNVLASMVFAGMSGSNTADVAGLGKIEIKAMKDAHYDPAVSAAVTAASSMIGPILPPSIILVVYAQLASVSTGRLFLAGLIPGILMALLLGAMIFFLVRVKPALAGETQKRASIGEVMGSLIGGALTLLAPVIIVGGMTLGIVTPSEAGGLAVLYAIFLGVLYRTFSLSVLVESLRETALFSGAVLFVIAASGPFGWSVNIMRIPEAIGAAILDVTTAQWIALLMMNGALLLLGCLEAGSAALIVAAPVLLYLGQIYGVDPVHLGIIAGINLTLGSMTPPVGLSLFIAGGIAGVGTREVIRAAIPFFLILVAGLALVTFIPEIALGVPRLLMGR